VRDLVGWQSYSYSDPLMFFRAFEMMRFLCFVLIQLVAFEHDEARLDTVLACLT